MREIQPSDIWNEEKREGIKDCIKGHKISEKIEQLIQQHKEMTQEVFYMLQELSLYDLDKLDLYEIESLELHKIALESERSLRLSFISDLEDLLSV